jgi:hypothetical protein
MTTANLAGVLQTLPEDCTELPTDNGQSLWSGHASVRYLLNERERTHGNYLYQSALTQELKRIIRRAPNWDKDMTPGQQEALDLILMKIVRIGCGDPSYADHWDDICGYAQLGKG